MQCHAKVMLILKFKMSVSSPPPNTTDPFNFSLSLPKDQPSFCPNYWVPYAGHCYFLERTKKMWREALAACHKEGGDLASIHNIEEQSFIISQSGYCKYLKWLFFVKKVLLSETF